MDHGAWFLETQRFIDLLVYVCAETELCVAAWLWWRESRRAPRGSAARPRSTLREKTQKREKQCEQSNYHARATRRPDARGDGPSLSDVDPLHMPILSVVLWSEMTWLSQITRESATEVEHAIGYSVEEYPVVLQLGGGDPAALARAVAAGAAMGYDEINLNCGCPAGSRGEAQEHYGARLMAEPERVGECCCAMHDALDQASCDAPVTVKCRLGVDGRESYEELHEFVAHVSTVAGVKHFIVHARHAMLGLNAAKTEHPAAPARLGAAARRGFPSLRFTINGGITTLEQAVEWLRRGVHGVMIGRQAAAEPYLFARAGRAPWVVNQAAAGAKRSRPISPMRNARSRSALVAVIRGHSLARYLRRSGGSFRYAQGGKVRAALTEVTRGTGGGAVPSFGALGVLVHGRIKACCIPEELPDTRPALSIPVPTLAT